MGLFGSILKPFKSVFGGLGKALFGSPDKVKWTDPRKMIAPPSPQEKALLGKLYPYALSSFGRSSAVGNKAYGLLQKSFDNLNKISNFELPDPYKRAIESTFKDQLGRVLNETAKRGIVNSSITQGAINDALRKTFEMKANLLPQALQMSVAPFSTLRDIEKDYLQMPSNMWAQLMNARYGVRAMPVVQKGSPGLLGALGMGAGAGIGAYLGGPVGAMVGGQIGGALGSSLASSLR